MLDADCRFVDRAAFDAQTNLAVQRRENRQDTLPVDDSLATRTADRCAGDFASLLITLLNADIFRMKVNQTLAHMFEPGIRVLVTQLWPVPR